MANEKATFVNRAEIASAIAANCGLSREQAESAAREYEAAIMRAVLAGQEVRLTGFGSFKLLERAARTGRNPATGQTQEFPAKKVPRFVPSKLMKDAALPRTGTAAEAAEASAEAPAQAVEAPAKKAPRKLGKGGGKAG